MRPGQARFVTLCQQLLALGAVIALLTPATGVISLDIVAEQPGSGEPATGRQGAVAKLRAEVPTEAVAPTVTEVPLTLPAGVTAKSQGGPPAATLRKAGQGAELVSDPQRISGYGTVGVTWAPGEVPSPDELSVQTRTSSGTAGTGWSEWQDIEYHDDHGPDPGSEEAKGARPGTDPLVVGEVGEVQVRVRSATGPVPTDLRLALIEPGEAVATREEAPELDTADESAVPGGDPSDAAAVDAEAGEGAVLRATKTTARPKIFSRKQWGADERLRSASSLRYFEVHAGFVHHTVNANEYTKEQVPGIIRGIYAYHTRSRGWSDIGYNFLVDRFGRIWEGRYGGIARPVVGAHTLGYNDYAFAMSAIGNFETAHPKAKMVRAYGALMAWKLSLHGVSATSTSQRVGSRTFAAINGHRDAGSTACPGRYLYEKLPRIRKLAGAAQAGWAGRDLQSDVTNSGRPDLVVRRASDGQVLVVPIRARAGGHELGKAIETGVRVPKANRLLNVGDWDRDGFGDIVVRTGAGNLVLYRGDGTGSLARHGRIASGFGKVGLLAAVGDTTGDGYPDLMGQPAGGSMRIYEGRGTKRLDDGYVAYRAIDASRQIGIGRWDADGAPDSIFRKGGSLTVMRGNGPGGLTGSPTSLLLRVGRYGAIVGVGSVTGRGTGDLVVRAKKSGRVFLIRSKSDGTFAKRGLLGDGAAYDLIG